MKKKTREQFIEDARKIHGNKYDYSKVEYVNSHTKVCIKCPIHGEFLVIPNDHTSGVGCKKCYYESRKALVAGVGVNDVFHNIKEKDIIEKSYKQWASMLHRCYDGKEKNYLDCSVCDKWLTYSAFKEWHDKHYIEDWQLDKDLLKKGNKVYSPETCCFVPQEINKMLTKTNAKRGDLPIGVTSTKYKYKKYRAQISLEGMKVNLGYFPTKEGAFAVYKIAKEGLLKGCAEYWKDKLEPRVYEALYNYRVEITD